MKAGGPSDSALWGLEDSVAKPKRSNTEIIDVIDIFYGIRKTLREIKLKDIQYRKRVDELVASARSHLAARSAVASILNTKPNVQSSGSANNENEGETKLLCELCE